MTQTLEKFSYIGKWKGPKGAALGTVTAVSKNWVFTAGHVAELKAANPNRRITIEFGGWSTENLERVQVYPGGSPDVALVKLGEPLEINHFPKIRAQPLLPEDGEQEIVIVGKSGVYHGHRAACACGEKEFRLRRTTNGPKTAAGGDSGGAWIQRSSIETQTHILLAILLGGGRGTQPGALRDWIEDVMGDEAAQLQWA